MNIEEIDAVFFDLDGTLLGLTDDDFMRILYWFNLKKDLKNIYLKRNLLRP